MSISPILLAAGGTGGHLFPAVALAQELARRGWIVDLVTDRRAERYGAELPVRALHQVPAATFGGRATLVRTSLTLAHGVVAAYRLLLRLRPAAVIGFGGYPTVPPLIAAALARLPRAVHEQNAVMGRANRLLARHATAAALSFDDTRGLPRHGPALVRVTGNPVRTEVIAAGRTAYVPPVAGGPLRLLVFGGSQGARFFADAIPEALAAMPAALRGRLAVVQQCRPEDLERVGTQYGQAGIAAELAPFFRDLPARAAKAHLIIARSGASTVAELAALGRPAILVPFPHALDNDQLENATRAAAAGAAWLVPQAEASPARLAREIDTLLNDPPALAAAAAAARRRARPDAVERLAELVEELAERSPGKRG